MGQDEDPSPAMACACFSRREQSCLWRVAHAAKAVGDVGKSQIDMPFDIFAEHPFGIGLSDDAGDVGPQVARIVAPPAFSGAAEGLAGITGRDDMNAAAPWPAVEGFKIVPNRGLAQGRVFHPGHEGCRSMGFPLDISHSPISGLGDMQSEIESAVAGAERDASQVAFMNAGGM
ncbi:hypothetical protein FHS51_001435 [Sphingobium wenxiniae]|nr:hypothetical protein [Sphingobium wenxiniae]MBB6191213.1 hypothetical protein [Sphingobium wenxiniae]